MTTATLSKGCQVFALGIDSLKKQIREKESQIRRDQALIEKLQSLPDTDPEIIAELRSRIARLEDEIENSDRPQLNAFEEEFAASCR
jgi:chromosome segregation ATPase